MAHRGLQGRRRLTVSAGENSQQLRRTKGVLRRVPQALDLLLFGAIGHNSDRRPAVPTYAIHRVRYPNGISRTDDHTCAVPGQADAQRRSQSARAAGNDRGLAAKIGVHHPAAAAYRNTAIERTANPNRAAATRALSTVRA